jgi:hypothetical protein
MFHDLCVDLDFFFGTQHNTTHYSQTKRHGISHDS